MATPGEPSVIRKIGGKEETRLFLEKLGFVTGGEVTVISETGGKRKFFDLCVVRKSLRSDLRYGSGNRHGLRRACILYKNRPIQLKIGIL